METPEAQTATIQSLAPLLLLVAAVEVEGMMLRQVKVRVLTVVLGVVVVVGLLDKLVELVTHRQLHLAKAIMVEPDKAAPHSEVVAVVARRQPVTQAHLVVMVVTVQHPASAVHL